MIDIYRMTLSITRNEAMKMKKTYHWISHTHWDREWYLPFEQFRYRLANLIDNLLDLLDHDSEFRYFHLDGQTIVLDDYYALRPSNRERLESHIRTGRILIGPWFEQNDLFLTSGESTVRNLMLGIRLSRELGGEMKVGYLPDHFGLIGQMPQIFRGVGIDNCVFGRGFDLEKHGTPFFAWRSPDGAEVTGLMLYHWYNNAQRLPIADEALRSVFDGLRRREEAVHSAPHLAMMNGVDHLEPQYNLSQVLAKLREMYGQEIELVHSTLPQYVRLMQDYMQEQPDGTFPSLTGELRECFEYNILAGTLSARVYVKQANVRCHDLIEKWAEPLSAWCQAKGLDRSEHETLAYIWRLYMENHPHDSICGCSQDSVHDHMMDRYQRIEEVTMEIIDRKLALLAGQLDVSNWEQQDQMLLAVNLSQAEYDGVQTTSLYFLEEDNVKSFRIENSRGEEIPYQVIRSECSRIQVNSAVNLPGVHSVVRWDIEWQPKGLPALSYAAYRVRPHFSAHPAAAAIVSKPSHSDSAHPSTFALPVLENEHIRVELLPHGAFDLLDKATGTWHRELGQFVDDGDRGDSYVFSRTEGENASLIWREAVQWIDSRVNDLYAECAYRLIWELPAELEGDLLHRSQDKKTCMIEVHLRLEQGARQLNLTINVNNQVRDHRLRLRFRSPAPIDYVWAGGQFDAVRRSANEGKEWKRDANSQPYWKWFAPISAAGGLAVFARGLHDYEVSTDGSYAETTLLRAVETINVRDRVALEQDRQLKAQCLGSHQFELAIRPTSSDPNPTRLYCEAERFHQGIRTKLYPVNDVRWLRGRAWVQDSADMGLFREEDRNAGKPRLPLTGKFLELDGKVMLSAFKWAEDGSGPVLRLYNVEDTAEPLQLAADFLSDSIWRVNLLEEREQLIQSPYTGECAITIQPKQIVTLKC